MLVKVYSKRIEVFIAETIKKSYVGAFYLFLGMAVFGSATLVSKLINAELPIFTASFLRVFLGSLFLLPFVAKVRPQEIQKIKKMNWAHATEH